MTETAADNNTENDSGTGFQTVGVGQLTVGSTVKAPDGSATGITAIRWERDDYGNDAVAVLERRHGGPIRVSAAATVELAGSLASAGRAPAEAATGTLPPSSEPAPSEPPLPLIPAEEGTPEAVVANAAAAHGGHESVQRLAAKLSKGLNFKSGANLQDVQSLAQVLFVELNDEANAVAVGQLITELPFDGNPGRWTPIAHCLALNHYIARTNADTATANRLAELLRVPDRAETDPFRAKMNAMVRQRSLNEPNLYDKEIARTAAAGERQSELDWRLLRLLTLLELLAHGSSETFDEQELLRRISNELTAIRAGS